ncbi:MAG TPA: glycosyltransferase family 4 protein [Calditrichia bacterium]|nr:glycosyltransferase family 4 protein [Calditrichia bacterium]
MSSPQERPIRVLMAAGQANFLVGGGANVQLQQTRHHLPEFGVTTELFDPWRAYTREEFDLVHIFGAHLNTLDLAERLADLGFPLVVSTIFFTRRGPLFMRFTRGMERWSRKVVGGIITSYGSSAAVCNLARAVLPNTSEEAAKVIRGLGITAAKVTVIPNGVEERFAKASPDLFVEKYGLRDFILSVGHIGSYRKNMLNLIKALEGVDTPAVIIGKIFDNAYARQCREAAKRVPNLTLLGGLEHDDPLLASAYAACKVFALPAFFETPGIAAMEAALGGASVAITPYGGTKDYFGGMVEYVEPGNPADIRRGIEAALSGGGQPGLKQHILDNYLWREVARKTAAVYRRVVSE